MTPSPLPEFKVRYLKPGEIFLATEPSLVTTVLGSCISITMHHRASRLSVICHAAMPSSNQARNRKKLEDFLYVDSCLTWMIGQYSEKQIKPRDIEVKMFGGSSMFTDHGPLRPDTNVGRKNIDTALDILRRNGFTLAAWNVGGSQGRKLINNTATGEILTKFITRSEASCIDFGGKK